MQTDGWHFAGQNKARTESKAPTALALAFFFFLAALLQWCVENEVLKFPPLALTWGELGLPGVCSLHWPRVREGEWWRLFAYCAAHSSYIHAACSVLGIYALARAVEPIIGPVQVLCAALLGILTGALTSFGIACAARTTLATGVEFPHVQMSTDGADVPALLGALPLLACLVGVYSTILPGWRIGSASSFGTPFPLTAGAFGWLSAVGCSLWWASGWFPEAGPAPMLGGLAAGWAYARLLGFGGLLFAQRGSNVVESKSRQIEEMDWEEFLRTELNPVLEKISTQGIHSLTRAEWKILQQSRRKLEGW
jgi:membrane associated rhomboid family serine protease